jgi:predicted regulator of Ras-like GTPase activity (Roadblock/LC7/MglB family)
MTGSECDDDGEIGRQLRGLIQRTDALTALLLTLDGRSVSAEGDTAQVNTAVLAVLVVELVSDAREVARVVGEDRFSTVLQHGTNRHVHISLLGDSHVLAVVFEDDRQTGLMRFQARRTAESLTGLLSTQGGTETDRDVSAMPAPLKRRVDPIDRIFGIHKRTENDDRSQ